MFTFSVISACLTLIHYFCVISACQTLIQDDFFSVISACLTLIQDVQYDISLSYTDPRCLFSVSYQLV